MKMLCLVLVNTIPMSVGGVLLIFALMIMSGMGWVGAQSHMRHADNKEIKVSDFLPKVVPKYYNFLF